VGRFARGKPTIFARSKTARQPGEVPTSVSPLEASSFPLKADLPLEAA
jgi:hypothetical protein